MSTIPFPGAAPLIHADAKIDILDLQVDATAVVQCRCGQGTPFLVSFLRDRPCPACGTLYAMSRLHVVPDPQGRRHNMQVKIGPASPSGIAMPPEGGLDG